MSDALIRSQRSTAISPRPRSRTSTSPSPIASSARSPRSAHARALLGESAAVVTERMPALTRELRQLREEWETQSLLDPPRAKRALQRAETRLIEAEPDLSVLRARQDEIVAEIRGLLGRARES